MVILNVDDDIDDREMFQAALDEVDSTLTCIQFESGSKVLEYLAHVEVPPDFIFVDINMPKMNGYECVERIRQISRDDHMIIVMYSTAFNPMQQERFRDLGLKYVQKTSKFSELVQSLKRILLVSRELAEKLKR